MNNVVKIERPATAADVALVLIDNPPVNAIGTDVYEGLQSTLESLERDSSAKAVVIAGEGRTFIAGADIKLLEAAARGEAIRLYLGPLLTRIENFPKPVIVALHGTALGGGMELAMSAHYRVAAPEAQMGQPEVNLGIIPGAEGTQRLPRLVGVGAAIDMCVSGKPIKAPEALKLGIIDRIIEGDLRKGAIAVKPLLQLVLVGRVWLPPACAAPLGLEIVTARAGAVPAHCPGRRGNGRAERRLPRL